MITARRLARARRHQPREQHRGAALPAIVADQVRIGYGERVVVPDLDLAIEPGSWVALVGPNGSGKSTILRAMCRLLAPADGTVLLDGRDVGGLSPREVATTLAVVSQGAVAPAGITVRELVTQGRHPHRALVGAVSAEDRRAVAEAMELTGIEAFADRYVERLSGGERQRVWIALALAQEPRTLLLDEPTTFLDIGHQVEVLDLVAKLRRERHLTIVAVLHDLAQAARYADRMIALRAGEVVADGPPREVVTTALVADLFGVHASIVDDPVTGAPVVLPYASLRGSADRSVDADVATARTSSHGGG
ncbi:ABC transporter ATP-binding protein [Nocardioides sp. R-C-SC26]|uniref:ABC transporter ATP-binding protein n=1 Tax=Nocardioides sp. R-C-SC26 TaxID=2870414 RepID=UPI001E2EA0C6|nr:ABC transporter ATP-binding protein [Nocardioides sp. R-C-SC26]